CWRPVGLDGVYTLNPEEPVMSAWQIAAGLAVAALLVLLLPSTATNAQGPERGSTKHSKNEIKQIRDYRKSNPSASLVEAVRAVEGRGK
ncbi:hypothetical protein, partial [Glutamicibacter arilaitensis]|uniref:hypothetical protein n=1 Tax=Glutamicibacter arilaitensis TaxID=256701 RepID=UPI001D02D5C2